MDTKNDMMEYEKYSLILKHYMTESNGKNVLLDEPLVANYVMPIAEYPQSSMINQVLDMLWRGMKKMMIDKYTEGK